jgi:serine/threonine-protein kinase
MDTLIGKSLQGKQYTLTELLGQGGFGITFKATHHFLEETCVVKTLNPQFRNDPQFPVLVQKFRDEAKRLKVCEHPNIVRMRDFFVEDGVPYLIMDYIPGRSLEQIVFPDQPLSEAEAVHYIRQIGSALALVHQKGLLHRDLKPENIILRQDTDQAVLIDFGIAREFVPGQTQSHTNLVTVGYAPVEQYMVKAKRTPASDVYGLAATLYALVTAQVPVASIMRDRQSMPEPRTLNSHLSPALNQAILRGMALDVEQRPATIAEWIALLPEPSYTAPATPVAKFPATAPTLAVSPPPPPAAAASPSSRPPFASPPPVAKTPAASTAATLAVGPVPAARPPRTAATVAPVPLPPPPARRSGRRGLIFLGLVSLTSMAIAAVATVLYHSSQWVPVAENPPSAEVAEAPEVPEAPEDSIAPETTPSSSASPESASASEPTESPPIILPDLSGIWGDADPTQQGQQPEQTQEQTQTEASDRPPPDPATPPRPGSQLPTDATIRSVPGFSPGTRERQIVNRLGEPERVRDEGNGLHTAIYVVPEQVDLVYIYDQRDRLQRSEAYFAPYMDFNVMRTALNGMLDNRSTGEIEQALETVRRGQAGSVPIETEKFQGVIENTGDRIYVGVWER